MSRVFFLFGLMLFKPTKDFFAEMLSLIYVNHVNQMKDSRDGTKTDRISKSSSVNSLPLILDIDDFKVKT